MITQPGKEHLVHRQYSLPKGCSVTSFTIREIDGMDEREAAKMLAAIGTADDMTTALMEANLRVSIVAVNGQAIAQPYTEMSKWSSKTRRFLIEAFNQLNGVPEDEIAAFLGAAEAISPTGGNVSQGEIMADELPSSKTP